MVDVDGVVVRAPDGRRWDADLEADLGIRPDDLQRHFFQPHFADIVFGRSALEERLAIALPVFAAHVTPEQLMAYWFARDAHLDHALLDELAAVRAGGLELHLATVQEHRRAEYLWTTLGLKDRFDGLHHSAAVGCGKPDPAYFAAVERRTGFAPAQMVLIDDRQANVDGARAAGWSAVLWTGRERLRPLLAPWLG